MVDLDGLPGAEMIARGIRDLARGERTVEAFTVAVAARRLAELGLPLPSREHLPAEPELRLYEQLCVRSDDPFVRYRALLAELDSFVSSLEARGGCHNSVA